MGGVSRLRPRSWPRLRLQLRLLRSSARSSSLSPSSMTSAWTLWRATLKLPEPLPSHPQEMPRRPPESLACLKLAEIQAAAAEREAAKMQQELDLLVADLTDWKDRYGEICVELEQTFNEMAGY